MIRDGDEYAQEIIDLFNQHDTLSEFNSPTYTGVSLYGLVLWSTYLPDDSIMAQNGPRMVIKTWESVAQVWHPGLRNMAGPWDRAYGYDMHEYMSLMALWLWPIIGQRQAGLADQPETMLHVGDYCYAPMMAILTGANNRIASEDTLNSLKSFGRERTYKPSAYSPPYDNTQRDYSIWLDRSITIGGVTFDQIHAGGAGRSPEAFNPAVVQWDTGREVGWIRVSSPQARAPMVVCLSTGTNITSALDHASCLGRRGRKRQVDAALPQGRRRIAVQVPRQHVHRQIGRQPLGRRPRAERQRHG